MKDVYALIMAGGSGERFWPRSRSAIPKQLLSITGKNTMLQETIKRILPRIPRSRIMIIAGIRHLNQIRRQLPGIKKENIIIEPWPRNTALAIGLSALWIKKKDPEGIMIVLPADQVIKDKQRFFSSLSRAVSAARSGSRLITLGLIPRCAYTGYGYIKKGAKLNTGNQDKLFKVSGFTEKPNSTKAKKFVSSGKYLWNSGIFVWKAKDILEAIKKYMPQLSKGLADIESNIGKKGYPLAVDKVYKKADSISIDYGILEKAKNVCTIAADMKWDDVGSWVNIAHYRKKDAGKNVSIGLYKGIDTWGSVIIGQDDHLVATVGLSDMVVVHTKDATLVCRKDRAQDVKKLVKQLNKTNKLRKFI
jgi:mannose-1-phosphate guanylyltransferase